MDDTASETETQKAFRLNVFPLIEIFAITLFHFFPSDQRNIYNRKRYITVHGSRFRRRSNTAALPQTDRNVEKYGIQELNDSLKKL